MQMIGPFRKELRYRTDERCGRRCLKYVDGRKATNAAAARGQSLPLPRSGLVQRPLSCIEIQRAGCSKRSGPRYALPQLVQRRFRSVSLVGQVSQSSFVVLSAIENPDYDHFGLNHLEYNRRSTLEAHSPKAWANVIPSCAPFRHGLERHTSRLDPVDISAGNRPPGIFGDVVIKPE